MWYSGLSLAKCIIVGVQEEHFKVDVSVLIVEAADKEEALKKLTLAAKEQVEVSYENMYGEVVEWVLDSVIEVQEVEGLYDGAMIHSYMDSTGRNLLSEPDEARLKAYFGE